MKKVFGTVILSGFLAVWTCGNVFAQAGGGGAGGGASGGTGSAAGTGGSGQTGTGAGVQPMPGSPANGLNAAGVHSRHLVRPEQTLLDLELQTEWGLGSAAQMVLGSARPTEWGSAQPMVLALD